MKKKKSTITGEPLRLEIQPDGNAAGVYQGNLLVVGFKWRDSRRFFELIPINQEWEDLVLKNEMFQLYLNAALEDLRMYRIEALKLAEARGRIQDRRFPFFVIGQYNE